MKTFPLLGALLLPMALGACGMAPPESRFYSDNPSFNHPIQVQRAEREHTFWVDARGRVDAEPEAWTAIATDYARRGWGKVRVIGHSGDVRTVARLLADAGVPVSALEPMPDRSAPRGVTVTYGGAEARGPSCGAFNSDAREPNSMWNVASSEFGCSTQNNIAAMISDPRDLMRRRGSEAPYGAGPGRAGGRVQDYGSYERPSLPTAGGTSSGGGR